MRRIAWTRLMAIALAIGLVAHAAIRAAAHVWLGEACAALEGVAAILLLRARTRATGVLIGVAATSVAAGVAFLAADFDATVPPLLLMAGLLIVGHRMDRAQGTARYATRHPG